MVAGILVSGSVAEEPSDKEVKTFVTTYMEIFAIELNKHNKFEVEW